ncbi:sialate O-acetylesterase [uncultured Dysgonomonas sp.]|uniref:Sialate O-acetylesterase domain-containing protein n=1 Tax=uncultured Dysgonomonas sp. TaxID=206096 RepID=A0A212JG71_9BACT|nr:sialate O-acetylesterase [uncultured Dysgonomonas sp.]SBV98446.1 conserved hypothetical protein [uncultured Dysgonomonas sp.]
MAKKFTSKIGLQPIYSTKDPDGNPATLGEAGCQIMRENLEIIEEILEEKAEETDADGNKVVRSPDGKILSSEKGQDRTKAPDLKLFTEEIEKLEDKVEKVEDHTTNAFIHVQTIEEPGFAVCDVQGNCGLRIDESGKTFMNLDSVSASEFLKEILEKGFAISDRFGFSPFAINAKGETDLNLSKATLKRIKQQLESLDSLLQADYNHIVTYGQSLGEGSQASPILTTSSFSKWGLMFNHGIKTRYATAPTYQSFVAHIERQDAENGETPAAGTADMFIQSAELNESDNKYVLSSCCARGATTVNELSKGTTWYNNIIADVTNGKRIAEAQGKTYRLIAVTWTQGEYDYGNGIAYYKGKLKQLRSDLINDVHNITGDDYSDLPFITYQVSSSYTAGKSYPDIGLALLQLAQEENSGFYMATPIYQLQYADSWHLKNFSSKLLGAYYGLALFNVLFGNDWKPLYPASHIISGNSIYLKFNKKGLTFSKPPYITATITNRGLSLLNASSAEIIQSVTIIESDTIEIKCSESPTGLTLTYGFANSNNRNAGEIRDNSDMTYTIADVIYPMYNWCSIFEYKL